MNHLLVLPLLIASAASHAEIIASRTIIETQPGATSSDLHAAQELRDHLSKITGKSIPLVSSASKAQPNAIVVGQGPLARKMFPSIRWAEIGDEQTLIRSKGSVLLVAGGKPRGTLYAVYRLLQVKCGVRWWTPWATTIPKNPKLVLPAMDWSEKPGFEYRDPYWFHSFDADWAARNFDNGIATRVDDQRGGKTIYQGFVHTYYPLVPPEKLFAIHPEWYSLIDGKRTSVNAQLCTTNPALRDYVVERVRQQLRANPKATIVSVSQNDCFNPCQCPVCRALAAREGSDSALVLDLANYVGEKIEKEFPHVAVDTLAYQWSRHPPLHMKPRPNVIVRLCSIECNFAYPLSAPQNASFGNDIRGWNKLTNRLYVWDYCTNFANYMQPHPDYFTLGPTLSWFSQNGVKGVFEEGDYTSNGGDMAELKAWLIAQMLWDPKQDPHKLIDEFLTGYYGKDAGMEIKKYLRLMSTEAQKIDLTFALGVQTPMIRPAVIRQAENYWAIAYTMAGDTGSPIPWWRTVESRLSLIFVELARWKEYPFLTGTPSRDELSTWWLKVATTSDPRLFGGTPTEWSPVSAINEGGTTPRQFIAALGG